MFFNFMLFVVVILLNLTLLMLLNLTLLVLLNSTNDTYMALSKSTPPPLTLALLLMVKCELFKRSQFDKWQKATELTNLNLEPIRIGKLAYENYSRGVSVDLVKALHCSV